MFKLRIISFTGLLAVLAVIFWGGRLGMHVFSVLAAAVAGLMVYELGTMLDKVALHSWKRTAAAVAVAVMLVFSYWTPPLAWLVAAVFAVAATFSWFLLLTSTDFAVAAKKTVVSTALLALTLPIVCALEMIGSSSLAVFAYVVLVTKAGDTGAYCVGMLSNKITRGRNHKIAPRISPNKSFEGAIGGLVITIGVSLALGMGCGWVSWSWPYLIIAGILMFWGSFFGDLTESALKRGCGVKDSASILPGMGGIWDVMDSFIYNAPALGLIFLLFSLN